MTCSIQSLKERFKLFRSTKRSWNSSSRKEMRSNLELLATKFSEQMNLTDTFLKLRQRQGLRIKKAWWVLPNPTVLLLVVIFPQWATWATPRLSSNQKQMCLQPSPCFSSRQVWTRPIWRSCISSKPSKRSVSYHSSTSQNKMKKSSSIYLSHLSLVTHKQCSRAAKSCSINTCTTFLQKFSFRGLIFWRLC